MDGKQRKCDYVNTTRYTSKLKKSNGCRGEGNAAPERPALVEPSNVLCAGVSSFRSYATIISYFGVHVFASPSIFTIYSHREYYKMMSCYFLSYENLNGADNYDIIKNVPWGVQTQQHLNAK